MERISGYDSTKNVNWPRVTKLSPCAIRTINAFYLSFSDTGNICSYNIELS